VFDIKIHGYIEKENLDALVKECERKNYAAINLADKKVQEGTTNVECSSYMDWSEYWTKNE
jgi:hypothetical protein